MRFCQTAISLAAALALWALPAAAQGEAAAPAWQPTCPRSHGVSQWPFAPPLPKQDYEPSPAMWKLSDEDTTIYIFGTFHVLPEGFRWRTPLLDKVIAETDEVVFESRDDSGEPQDEAGSLEEQRFFALLEGHRSAIPLTERIAARNRPKLIRLLDLAGIPLADLEYAPPVLAMFAIADATVTAEGSQRSLGVESVIEAEFKASGRPISAIEDPIAVLANLFAVDETQMIAMIDEGLDEWDGCSLGDPADTDWSSEHKWAQGKLDGSELAEMLEDPFSKAFYDVLLVDRNRAWTEWLTARMAQPGKLLLAVGAGHMEGDDSVILMLAARGLVAERIQ